MFERYFDEGGEWVPTSGLSGATRRNLKLLEEIYGVQWDDQARKAKFGWAPSYLIEGTGPAGEEVFLERRETARMDAGQTFVWVDGRRFTLRDLGLKIPSVSTLARDLAHSLEVQRHRAILEAQQAEVEELLGDVEDLDPLARSRLETIARQLRGPIPWPSLTKEERAEFRKEAERQREEMIREMRGKPLPRRKDKEVS